MVRSAEVCDNLHPKGYGHTKEMSDSQYIPLLHPGSRGYFVDHCMKQLIHSQEVAVIILSSTGALL